MRKRSYRLGKRADAAASTRRRIVEATLELHDEQGISVTTFRDIAGRAAVAPSTVLQHFPQMAGLIRACGELSGQLAPMPDATVLVGVHIEIERLRRAATALFEWWELLHPGLDHLRGDRHRIPEVDAWFGDVARHHRALARSALATRDSARVDLFVALTTADAWITLRDAGLRPAAAADRVARLIGKKDPRSEEVHLESS